MNLNNKHFQLINENSIKHLLLMKLKVLIIHLTLIHDAFFLKSLVF